MKLLILFSLITFAHAKDCQQFEAVGKISTQKDHLLLTLAQGTQSEKKIKIPIPVQSSFAPYINQTVRCDLIMNGLTIKKVNSIQRTVIDRLNQGGQNTLIEKGPVSCP